jgi:hypothetical protein
MWLGTRGLSVIAMGGLQGWNGSLCKRAPGRMSSLEAVVVLSGASNCVKTPAEELALFPATTRLHRNSASSSLGRRCLHDHPAPPPSAARQLRHLL